MATILQPDISMWISKNCGVTQARPHGGAISEFLLALKHNWTEVECGKFLGFSHQCTSYAITEWFSRLLILTFAYILGFIFMKSSAPTFLFHHQRNFHLQWKSFFHPNDPILWCCLHIIIHFLSMRLCIKDNNNRTGEIRVFSTFVEMKSLIVSIFRSVFFFIR